MMGQQLIQLYRDIYGIFCCSGILYNHESEFRKKEVVTNKIIKGVSKIHKGSLEKLTLGNLNSVRDWTSAKDFVNGMNAEEVQRLTSAASQKKQENLLKGLREENDRDTDFISFNVKKGLITPISDMTNPAASMQLQERENILKKYGKPDHNLDRKSTRLNSSHVSESRMPSSA